MITKNANYGKTENVTVIEMGTGDVHMFQGLKKNNSVSLVLKTLEPMPINVKIPHDYKSFDELQPEVVFIFTKSESIDSMISMLQSCKEEINKL
jgi:hypothetical protein